MSDSIGWAISDDLVHYPLALSTMEAHVERIQKGEADECVWLLEHPPIYTSGTSATDEDLFNPDGFPVFNAGRGGQFTYHGPGQRVAYVMLDLSKHGRDVRGYVQKLENWIISTLDAFNIKGEVREGRVGVWVDRTRPNSHLREDKIAAIGVRIRRWVSFHGLSLNVEPDLAHFNGIVPCGIQEQGLGVTSLADLGIPVSMPEIDIALRQAFEQVFEVKTHSTKPPQ